MEYQVIRSARKTLALQVTRQGVVVRAPRKTPDAAIRRFVQEHEGWIEKQQSKLLAAVERVSGEPPLTAEEIRALARRAMQVIPERVRHYAPLVGVSYGRITIRNQKTKWGSCTGEGNLNFNCLLMLAPPQVLDAVVVHELCHRREMNHSDAFYAHVLRVYPEYHKWNRWLKENGGALMYRMTGQ